jgi:lysozyme
MASNMTIANGLSLVKEFEGFRSHAYQDSVGVWTIGYGHTKDVNETDIISSAQAEALLVKELKEYENYVRKLVKVPLFTHQFDALVSWTYNLGPTNLKNSGMLKVLNQGKYDLVPNEMRRWNKAGGVILDGLVNRRNKEAEMFEGK